jgi:hypothetical protein
VPHIPIGFNSLLDIAFGAGLLCANRNPVQALTQLRGAA